MTKTKTSFGQKIGLFVFGLIVTLFLLEVCLRLGGWAFLSLQENANRSSAGAGNEYRIVCLGESTTALGGESAYPRQLEKLLNLNQNKIKFKVINKGVPATTTDQILTRVEGYLNEYHPQMIVAMMGVNDPHSQSQWTWRDKLSRVSKAFKLFDMIVRHLSARKTELSDNLVEKEVAKLDRQPASRITIEIAKINLYRSANRPVKEKAAIDKVLQLDPQNGQGWSLLGIYYQRQAEYQKALEAFQKSMPLSSGADQLAALERMAQCYKFLGDDNAAMRIYAGILKQWPQHPQANVALADIVMEQKKYQEAIGYFLQQLTVDPQTADVHDKLDFCYRKIGQPGKAQNSFKQKDPETAKQDGGYNLRTKENYLKLADIAKRRGISFFAMQYPSRTVVSLKDMLTEAAGVIFVDNRDVFADALVREGYDALFSDRFAGDFGHCTPQGNAILAGNLANAILKFLSIKM